MRHHGRYRNASGFSIIELLIAIIIIGILVAVIIPVLMNRAEEARVAAAESDLEQLQAAEERAAINTSYVYRFYVLDDTSGLGDGLGTPNPLDIQDTIGDERLNTAVVFPTRMFIDINTQDFRPDYANLYGRLTLNETTFGWQGPYINYHHLRDIDNNDLPEDPWGEEYLLFTRLGFVDQYQGVIRDTYFFFIPEENREIVLIGEFFDRFTVLSLGPNNRPGDGTGNARFGTDDDIYRQF